MGDRTRNLGRRQSIRRRLAIAVIAATPVALASGCYGHGHYSYHHGSSSYYGHYHHGHYADPILLPFLALYLLFWAAGSC
ncbi:MAG: hypothetical protein AAFV77_05970 [Planctomycetota bacterium]